MIYLEQFSLERYEELFSLIDKNRLFLQKTLPWLNYTRDAQDSFEFIKRTLETDKNQETMSYFIIEQEGNQLLGVFSLRDITTYRATIGYWLDEDHTKRGYMTQAAGLLLAKAKEKGIEEVILKCSPTNIGSQRVAEKLGFEYEYTQSKAENLYGVLGNLKVYIKYL